MSMFAKPIIPRALLRPMVEIRAPSATYSAGDGGQYIPAEPERIPFHASILPPSRDELRRAEAGTFSINTRKIYTNGYKLRKNTQIEDEFGQVYTITADLDHTGISPIRVYYAERIEEAASQ